MNSKLLEDPIISLIAAIGENRALGYRGRIPWHIPQDLRRFWHKTKDHLIIMGRKTFDSILGYFQKSDRSFPQRIFIIVTRDKNYQPNKPNCFIVHSVEEAIEVAKFHFAKPACRQGRASRDKEIFVAGGGEIYKQTIDLADKLYLTIVKGQFKADVFFPEYKNFKVTSESGWLKENGYEFKFLNLKKFDI